MTRLEDRLRPCSATAWPGDLAAIGLLAAMAAIMLPDWPGWSDGWVNNLKNQMASPCLLPAMGFLLALRRGAIDLSVWISFSLGGMTAAGLINAGTSPASAMLIGMFAGLLPGLLNAALVAVAGVPSPLATAGVGAALLWGLRRWFGGGPIAVPESTFVSWHLSIQGNVQSLDMTRMLIVLALYGAVMLALLWGNSFIRYDEKGGSRWKLAFSLILGAMLSAAGGAIGIIEHFQTLPADRLIGDLRIPAAAVLAGAAVLSGPGRTMLAGIALPLSLALTLVWRQDVWYMESHGYAFQIAAMIVMVSGAQFALRAALEETSARLLRATAGALAMLAVLAVPVSAYMGHRAQTVHLIAAAVWTLGILMAIAAYLKNRKPAG